ncbi:M20 aminoacylase family protein [Crenobacter sp. SG2303]|uniref:M20 aminoacylase family protein n=1 Tax=Crenobacter oryzisoli TaxID=3056844 RepID=A0ABT7XSM1_9NEIS|nr:M20 aminoacylase family protein [Crenobacter sp. SG2303]MDN0076802.1 M20 aminoacylase family protein [Crenobacter sp. SG2303]
MTEALKTLDQASIEQHFHYLHQHPSLAFEETQAASYIAGLLREWGYEVTEGIGKTGVVGRLKVGDGQMRIGLRADTDALPVQEAADLPYKSKIEGKSHTCGHDAHTAMLLGAAEYLAKTRNFNGTLNLIFQPAEEIMAGAPAMIADGLFERFPMDVVFGMHNMPGLPTGKLHFTGGPIMAAVDNWEIVLTGVGSHGSMPEKSIDPLVAGASLVMSLQTIVSRNVAPMDAAVVSVGAFLAGDAGNVIPQTATLRLSTRTRKPETREMVLNKIKSITKATAEAYNVGFEIREGQPGAVLINDAEQTQICVDIARKVFGDEQVVTPGPTFMGSEDFAFYAQKVPGVYCFIGNGNTANVHHPMYVFDKSNLPVGAAYWIAVAENYLK